MRYLTSIVAIAFVIQGCATQQSRSVTDQFQVQQARSNGDVTLLQAGAEGDLLIRQSTLRQISAGNYMAYGYQTIRDGSRTDFYDIKFDCGKGRFTLANGRWSYAPQVPNSLAAGALEKVCALKPENFEFYTQDDVSDIFINLSSALPTETSTNSFEFQAFSGPTGKPDFSRSWFYWMEVDCKNFRYRKSKKSAISEKEEYVSGWESLPVEAGFDRYVFFCGSSIPANAIRGYLVDYQTRDFIPKPVQPVQKMVDLKEAKASCSDIGFTEGTEAFGECVLKLTD